MYTEEDVKRLFSLRGEIELEFGVCKAQLVACPEDMPQEMKRRISKLESQLMTIDSLFAVLSENEAFVIRLHLLAELDWQQITKEYVNRWGSEAEKSTRSFQIYQTKALRKIAHTINTRLDPSWLSMQ